MAATLLARPVFSSSLAAELTVRREYIVFHNVAPGRVRLSVTVANGGPVCSEPTVLRIQQAPLGAFVAWNDLTALVVPPIEPGDTVEVATEFPEPGRLPGQLARTPPGSSLTAVTGN